MGTGRSSSRCSDGVELRILYNYTLVDTSANCARRTMSKRDKLLMRLAARPAPKDFSWNELLTVMGRCGFASRCDGGSHYMFEHEQTEFRVGVSRTHPGGILKAYQVKDVVEALTRVGALDGEERNG